MFFPGSVMADFMAKISHLMLTSLWKCHGVNDRCEGDFRFSLKALGKESLTESTWSYKRDSEFWCCGSEVFKLLCPNVKLQKAQFQCPYYHSQCFILVTQTRKLKHTTSLAVKSNSCIKKCCSRNLFSATISHMNFFLIKAFIISAVS